jgi:rhomboid protease GluP
VQYEAAQRGEVDEDAMQPVMPAPWAQRRSTGPVFTQALIGINAAVFVGMVLTGASIMAPGAQQLIQWGANAGTLTVGGQWWRLFTSMFLHIGIIHIAFNMWCLWDLGALCESLYGRWTFLYVYLVSGLSGSLLSVTWHPLGLSAGASGAIFGLAGALIASFYLGEFTAPREAIQGSLRSVVMFAVYNLIFGAVSGRTDNAAHIGGLAAGLIMGALIARVVPYSERPLRRATVLIPVLMVIIAGAACLQHARGYILHTRQATELYQQNRLDEASREFQVATRQRPDYAPAHAGLAYVYSRRNWPNEAEAEWKRVIALDPRNGTAYYRLGVLYLESKRMDAARGMFSQVLSIDPNNAYAHLGMGMVLASQGRYEGAIQEYRKAASQDSTIEGLNYNIGLACFRMNRPDEAIAAFLQEQSNTGGDYETEIALAAAYRAKGMQPQAEAAMRKAAELKAAKDQVE